MKIMFLHRLWPVYGGGETVTITLANEMVKRGIDVHVAFFKETDLSIKRPFLDKRIKWHRIEGVKFNEYSKDFFVDKKEATYVNNQLVQIIKEEEIDILHNQWWPVEFFRDAKTVTGVKVVTVLHMQVDLQKAFHFEGWKKSVFSVIEPLYRYVEKKKNLHRSDKYYKYSDKYVFLVKDFMDYYRKEKHLADDDPKTTYIHNPSTFDAYSDEEMLKEEKKEVLVVGRLVENHKQIFRLLRSWNLTQRKGLTDWHLVIVGDGPDRHRYEEMVEEQRISNVRFEGFQPPLDYYKRAALFCMTSAYEGFCMTLVEAQQNGCVPIVMDTFAACRVIIEDGKNGMLVKDGDEEAFAEAIVELANNRQKRMNMKEFGLQTCRRFHVTKIVDEWEKLYKELLKA